MIYAPVAIATLNRYEHFRRCVESLDRCNWADRTDVFIALDYPPSQKYEEGYRKICEYLDSARFRFKSFTVIRREKNYGAGVNPRDLLIHEIWPRYDRAIISEDDNVFAPTFLQFIDHGLEKCSQRDDILTVGGFAIPAKWKDDGYETVLLNSNANTWGYGIFRDTYFALSSLDSVEYYHALLSSKERRKRILSGSKNDCGALAWFVMIGRGGNNDTIRSIYLRDQGKYCLFPKVSKVFNTGIDGSGLSSGKKDVYGYTSVALDPRTEFDPSIFDDLPPFYEKETMKAVNDVFHIPGWKMLWVRFVFLTHSFWRKHSSFGKRLMKLYVRLNPRL